LSDLSSVVGEDPGEEEDNDQRSASVEVV
jgi:hypothetical protein